PHGVVIVGAESTASEHEELRARFERKDFDGTLAFALEILKSRPEDVEAIYYVKACRGRLAIRMHTPAYEFAPQPLPPTHAPPSKAKTDPRVSDLRAKFKAKDYEGAIVVAHKILRDRPKDLEAEACAEECRTALEALKIFSTASLKRVPAVEIAPDKLLALGLNHKAGFLLSLIDGTSSVEVILDVCAMPREEAIKVLHDLVEDGIVLFR
ncbi:MAG: hypothetical protein ABIP39_04525, partial [Polyangiaceae bacterium]